MLNGKDLILLGLKPGKDFSAIMEKCKTFATREEAIEFAKSFVVPDKEKTPKKPSVASGSFLEWLLNEGKVFVPHFLEGRAGEPSGSEIRRLVENHSVMINGIIPPANASMDNQFPIWQLIFFPKGERKTTLVDDPKPKDANPWFDCDGKPLDVQNWYMGEPVEVLEPAKDGIVVLRFLDGIHFMNVFVASENILNKQIRD